VVDDLGWPVIMDRLSQRHNTVGVFPYTEAAVEPLAAVAQSLGLSWSQPGVLPAFRDKNRLKSLIRDSSAGIRINRFKKVANAREAWSYVSGEGLSRFVLKPNDGSGNEGVSFYNGDCGLAPLEDYFRGHAGPALLEEFISGQEYWVNGQIDHTGEPSVVGVGRYLRVEHHGKENLEVGSVSVAVDDPVFEQLSDYARQVMKATGLRRSPFHLEAIIDSTGPCLVETGARFCGELGTFLDMWQHGPQLDLIDVALHYYLCDEPYGALPLDWTSYKRRPVGTALAYSETDQRLIAVEGRQRFESSPTFVRWIKRPEVGDHVRSFSGLTTRAWSAAVTGSSPRDVQTSIHSAREAITLHGTADGPWPLRRRLPMYAALAAKAWVTRPRPYQLKALWQR
jgi:hypothetical protein